MTAILWLRRDLRLADHPALMAASTSGPVLPLFVIEPRLWEASGPVRRGWLAATLQATRTAYGGLCLRVGDPAEVVPAVADEMSAAAVHITRETTPHGHHRDRRVERRLRPVGVNLVPTGSPFAVGPGTVRTADGGPYQVFSPFLRAWRAHGWPQPAPRPGRWDRAEANSDDQSWELVARAVSECPIELPAAGEDAARDRWRRFLDEDLGTYADYRDRPDLDVTSRLSAYLKLGVIHPRTLLADLPAQGPGAERFETELAWREFYGDVLWHHPRSAWQDLRPDLAGLRYDDAPQDVDAWRQGRTGYPIVDAGMRQLLHQGWMHNRVRMITASFLTKDLHVWWPVGARHFLDRLLDGDLASNSHGWQWVAGTGTDAAPYFRVFNPVLQGRRFDPDGDYVRRWVPELRHLPGAAVHEPWKRSDGFEHGYPERIVDHGEERRVALDRYHQARG